MSVYYVLQSPTQQKTLPHCSKSVVRCDIRWVPDWTTLPDNGANFKAAVQQLLDKDVTEENPACACHTFSLVVKNAIDPCKKKGYFIIISCCN